MNTVRVCAAYKTLASTWLSAIEMEQVTKMVGNPTRRAEFSEQTRELVAKRAAYRCSIPDCDKLTIGPALDPTKTDNTGIAAHIYGAALTGKGPRGTGGLQKHDLQSSQNAIWLCADHASLVDKRRGVDYSADILHSYKTLHETRVAHELAGIYTPFGWVHKFAIDSSPLFSGSFEIALAKLNLIIGGNSVGKTALCEWIAGTSNPTYLERWETVIPGNLRRVSTRVEYFSPERHCIEVDFLTDKYPRYMLDGEPTFVSTNTVKVIFPESIENHYQEVPNDLDIVVNSIKLHPYELKALCDELANNSDFFRGARFEESDEGIFMHVQVQTKAQVETRLLRLLASSEREQLMMELGIIAANKLSMTGPTLFILDANSWRIDTDWLKRYAEYLGSPACRFQTIASTRLTEINFDDLTWTGWKVIHLEGIPPDAVITTGIGNRIG